MIVIKNKFIPFKGYKCINLFGLVFTKDTLNKIDLNHERIHSAQILELTSVGFIFIGILSILCGINFLWLISSLFTYYLWYGVEYLIISIFNSKLSQNSKYRRVSLEEEAYNNELNLNYLDSRIAFSWAKYL